MVKHNHETLCWLGGYGKTRNRAGEQGECTACDDNRARTKARVFMNVDTAKTKLVDALAAHQTGWATAADREYALKVWTPKWTSAPKVCGPCLADATRRACELVDGRKPPPRRESAEEAPDEAGASAGSWSRPASALPAACTRGGSATGG